ncbi:protein of unknown function [Paraburkholderia kururiensis]
MGISFLVWTEKAVKGELPAKARLARSPGIFEGSTGARLIGYRHRRHGVPRGRWSSRPRGLQPGFAARFAS